MARPLDPFRTLEVPRDASLDEVKASYRRLAKLYHPDSAGERTLPRFLAIQAAYEALTEGPAALRLGKGVRTRPAGARTGTARPARPSEADSERARATRDAAGRPGRSRPGAGATGGAAGSPTGAPGSSNRTRGAAGAGGGSAGSGGERPGGSRSAGSGGTRGRRDRRTPNSTSYDGADLEPFEPEWQGASWYGESSGTYWTLNPREFADPRKHGPEYQARGRRSSRGDRTGPRATAAPGVRQYPGASRDAGPGAGEGIGPDTGPETTEDLRDDVSPGPRARSRPRYAPRPGTAAAMASEDPARDPARDPAAAPWSTIPREPAAGPSGAVAPPARPPFAVLGVFGIMLAAIATILVLSPSGPASAGFVPVIFLAAILASAGLVLSGIGGSRRA